MKRYLNLIIASALLPLVFMACQKEYQPGIPDLEGCYGVYFQELPVSESSIILAPADEKKVEFNVYRELAEGQIDVPCQVTVLEDGVATDLVPVSDIAFENGKDSTIVSFDLSQIKPWHKYEFQLKITDPLYRSNYSVNSNDCLAFSISLEDWKTLGTDSVGQFGESVVFAMLGAESVSMQPALIEERSDKPGYYRVSNTYQPELLAAFTSLPVPLLHNIGACPGPIPTFYVDATDPNKVTLSRFDCGWDFSPFGGPAGPYEVIMVPEKYGVLEDGVVTFEQGTVQLCVGDKPLPIIGEAVLILPTVDE